MADSVTATSTRIAALGLANTGTASVLPPARIGAAVLAEDQCDPDSRHRNHQRKMELRRYSELRNAGAAKPRGKEADAPERMRAVHDAIPDQVLGPVGLDVEDDFGAADHQADGKQQQKEGQGIGCMRRDRKGHRHQRNDRQQRAPKADPLQQRAGQRQRQQRADGHADQAKPKRAFLHAHRGFDVGQPREDVAQAERIDGKPGKDAVLRRKTKADAMLDISTSRTREKDCDGGFAGLRGHIA